jgi:anti-sigma factor RsiW
MTCDRIEQVHVYHDGQLGLAERLAVESHLATCGECALLLGELQAISQMVAEAPLPDVSDLSSDRYYAAWDVSEQRGLLRISSWLTAAAAAVLVGSLLLWPHEKAKPEIAVAPMASAWEAVAVMPPPERVGVDRPDELVELAQWMAEDLSAESIR